MSKIVKTVLVVAVAVAVVVFAPQIAAVLASVAGAVGVTVTTAALTSAIVGMGLSLALTATMSLFRKAPSLSQSLADRLNTSVVPTAPRKIIFGTTAGGQDVRFFESDFDLKDTKKDGYAQVIALASHRITAFKQFYVENDLVWSGGAWLQKRDGFAPQNPLRIVTEGKPGNGFAVGSGAYWRSSASFTGCAYYVPTWKLDEKIWESGIPQRLTAVVDGCPVYDPRRDSTRGGSGAHRYDNQDTWTFTDGAVLGRNPALALLTYLIGWRIKGKVVWGMGLPANRIDLDNFRTYANVCEEGVATAAGGTVQRYTHDGIYSTSDSHDTVINGITATMGSCKLTDRGGTYCLVGGYDDTAGPKVEFTADDLVAPANGSSPYIWNPAPASRERFNIVRGRFANPEELFQLTDWGDPIEQPALADGIPRTLTLDLGGVSRAETCQRIAKQFLLREYLTPGMFSATFGPKAFAVEVGSVITLSLPSEGWNSKLFRVMEQAESHDLFFTMTLREEDPAIYAWDREEKPLPASIRPQGYDASLTIAPEGLSLTSASYAGANGINVSEVHVTWTPENSGRVTGIQIQSRPEGSEAWTEQAAIFDPKAGTFTFTSNAPGITVEVRARYRMMSAVYSAWVQASIGTAPVLISYDDVDGTPGNLSDINPTEGGKLGGIEDGATVGGTIGKDIKNPDGTVYRPPSAEQLVDTKPPAVPTGLAITSKLTEAGATLDFTWNAVSDSDLAGYTIAIKQAGGNYVEFNTGSNSYTRDALPRGTSFTAKVSAFDKAGNESGFSAEVTATTAKDDVAPALPTNLTVDASFETAFVSFVAPNDADLEYVTVYLRNQSDGAYRDSITVAAAPGATGRVTFSKLQKAYPYYVQATATDTSGNSSVQTTGVSFTTAGGIAAGDFTPGLSPIQTVTTLPNNAGYTGPNVVFLQGEGKLYRYVDGNWTKSVENGDINNGSISSEKLVNYAVTAEKIATGAIDNSKLTQNSVGPANIVDGSIITGKIADGAIEAAKIKAGVIGTEKLTAVNRPFTINGLNIRIDGDGVMRWDNATVYYLKSDYTQATRTIAAGAIGPAGVIRLYYYIGDDGTNTNLDSRSNNDLSLDNHPVYKRIATWNGGTDLVVAEGVGIVWNGDRIVANSIKAGKIAAGTLTANEIASNTIAARNLLIADTTSYVEEPDFTAGLAGWQSGGFSWGNNPNQAYQGNNFAYLQDSGGVLRNKAIMKVVAGDKLLAFAYINDTGNVGPNGRSYVRISAVNAAGTEVWTSVGQRVTGGTSNYGRAYYQRVENADTVPDGLGIVGVRAEVVCYKNGGEVFVGFVGLHRRATANLIVDGAIIAGKIAAGAVTADNLQANSVTASKLVVASRPISVSGVNIRYENGTVRWDSGFITYIDDAGNYQTVGINGNYVAGVGASPNSPVFIKWALGNGFFDYTNDKSFFRNGSYKDIATWNGGTDLAIHAGVSTVINGDRIVTGTLSADKIVTRSIGADRIAAGAITSNEIAANTITAGDIAVQSKPVSLAGVNIRWDSDNVIRWDAGTIRYVDGNNNFITRTVSAGAQGWGGWDKPVNLCFNTDTDNTGFNWIYYHQDLAQFPQMIPIAVWNSPSSDFVVKAGVSTQITGDRIVTGSINAAIKITSRTITGEKIAANAITANEIQAGTITAAQIAAGAITARTLTLGSPDSVIPDGDFRDNEFWGNKGSAIIIPTNASWPLARTNILQWQPNGNRETFSTPFFSVEPNATYRFTVNYYADPNFNGWVNVVTHYPGVIWYSLLSGTPGVDPSSNNYWSVAAPTGGVASKTWIVQSPNTFDCNKMQFRFDGQFSGTFQYYMTMVRVSDTTLIKDGAITTDKMVANSIAGDRIQAGTLNADRIQAGSVVSSSVVVSGVNDTLANLGTAAQNAANNVWYEGPGVNSGINQWNLKLGNKVQRQLGGESWNSCAWTNEVYRDAANITGRLAVPGTFVGLSSTRGYNNSSDYNLLDYSFHRSDNGNYYAYERGNQVQDFGGSQGGGLDVVNMTIAYDGRSARYYRNEQLVREVAAPAGLTMAGGVTAVRQGAYVDGLKFTGGTDNSFVRADPAQAINNKSTTIDPGKITISGNTTLASWRYGGDTTKIEGGALGANTVSANKLTVGNRGIGYIGINFEWNPTNNWVYWSDGYIYYTNDAGALTQDYVSAGNTGGAGAHQWFYWSPGQGIRFSQENPGRENVIMLAAWWGGSNLNVTYGGTIINGDRITTNTIHANRIIAGTITASQIAANTIGADKLSVGSLSAISANIGTLVSYNGAGGRIERDGNGDRGYYNNGVLGYEAGFLN